MSPKLWGQPLIPDYDMAIEYDANGRQLYVGYCLPGGLTTEAIWVIYKMEYDSSGRMIKRRHAEKKANLDFIWNS